MNSEAAPLRHEAVASRIADYATSANPGECAAVANILERDRNCTGNEGAYARSMISEKAKLDRTLGPSS